MKRLICTNKDQDTVLTEGTSWQRRCHMSKTLNKAVYWHRHTKNLLFQRKEDTVYCEPNMSVHSPGPWFYGERENMDFYFYQTKESHGVVALPNPWVGNSLEGDTVEQGPLCCRFLKLSLSDLELLETCGMLSVVIHPKVSLSPHKDGYMQKLEASTVKGTKGSSVWFGQRSAIWISSQLWRASQSSSFQGLHHTCGFFRELQIYYSKSSCEYCPPLDRQAPWVTSLSHCYTLAAPALICSVEGLS